MSDTFFVKFFAPINADSVAGLMQIVDSKMKAGAKKLGLLISSGGGDVFHGLSAYNYLRGIPLEVTTHNFGSADSMGIVLFCAGTERYSVPHARFLLHGPTFNLRGPLSMEEKQLEEKLKSLQIDLGNISRIIADTAGQERDHVLEDMLNRTTLYPEQAVDYGLVHDIRSELMPEGAELYAIHTMSNKHAQRSPQRLVVKQQQNKQQQ